MAGECHFSTGWCVTECIIHDNGKNLFCAVDITEAVRENFFRQSEDKVKPVFLCQWFELFISV